MNTLRTMNKPKTTVALLRQAIGLTQKQFANMVKYKLVTIKFVEAGRRGLTGDLAGRIHTETGVNLVWLLANDTSQPIIDMEGGAYTLFTFERTQRLKASPEATRHNLAVGLWNVSVEASNAYHRIGSIGASASRKGKAYLFLWKLRNALDELSQQFGEADFIEMAKKAGDRGEIKPSARFLEKFGSKAQSKTTPEHPSS